MHDLAYWLGLTDPAGAPYLFWSGFAADVGLLAAGVALIVRRADRVTCDRKLCIRRARHQVLDVDGGKWTVCRRHKQRVPAGEFERHLT